MLDKLGWNGYFAAAWNSVNEPESRPCRVISQSHEIWRVAGEFGEGIAHMSGVVRQDAEQGGLWPAVGDWLAVSGAPGDTMRINGIVPRRTQIARKVAGRRIDTQVLAANVDVAFIVMGMDGDYSARRIERYLSLVWESGAKPVVVLNKADLRGDVVRRVEEMEQISHGSPVMAVSALTGEGLSQLEGFLSPGTTIVLLGSSGAGKSSLTNRLLGMDQQTVFEVRASDSRGRHTTTSRELILVPGGGVLIDTPGLRELQLWDSERAVKEVFADLEEFAESCRFRDCSHQGEPDCGVAEAIVQGWLDAGRLENYRKLNREREFLQRKIDPEARARAKASIKIVSRTVKRLYNDRERKGKL